MLINEVCKVAILKLVTLNVKNALKPELKLPETLKELEMLTCVAITASLLLISIGWFSLMAPNVPAVEPTNLEVSTTNDV